MCIVAQLIQGWLARGTVWNCRCTGYKRPVTHMFIHRWYWSVIFDYVVRERSISVDGMFPVVIIGGVSTSLVTVPSLYITWHM